VRRTTEEHRVSDRPDQRPDDEPDPFAGLPSEIADLLRGLGDGTADPQLTEMLKQFGVEDVDPQVMAMALQQMQSMLAGGEDDGPVDATRARDTARAVAAVGGDPVPSERRRRGAVEAVHLARLWLDEVTDYAGHEGEGSAMSRAEWVEATMPAWTAMVEPVATGVASAVAGAMQAQLGRLTDGGLAEGMLPPGMEGMLPPGTDLSGMTDAVAPMMRRMSSAIFSLQLGQAVGHLAGEVLTGTEVSLPLITDHQVALLPVNIDAFAEGLEQTVDEVTLYLAVREAARSRLFTSVPWLASALTAAVRDYARDLRIDTDAIDSAVAGADFQDPAALQEVLRDQLFTPTPSAAQQAALDRLETLLALVEGWVEVVTERATTGRMPSASALGETLRRRRATGGPAERTFASLVGLQLRPRRLRDAANLFRALEDRLGATGRDGAWRVPDLAPTSADLDDVLGYVEQAAGGRQTDHLDAALEELLRRGE
jgi:putative hydrolase